MMRKSCSDISQQNVVFLSVKVIASSSQDGIFGWLDKTLKIKVKAAAQKSRANAAVEKIILKRFNLPKGSVAIVKGASSSNKIVRITGINELEMRATLSKSTVI